MDMSEWILECMGMYNQSGYLDEIAKEFGVDLDYEQDTVELIQLNMEQMNNGQRGRLGDIIAGELYRMAIDRAVDELGLDEDKFEYYLNGSRDTDLLYDGEYVTSWEDLEKIADNQQ